MKSTEYFADDADPTITSPGINVPLVVPTLRILSVLFHVLTLAFAPEIEPVTSSLKVNVPIPVVGGHAIVTGCAGEYPSPGFTM